MSHSSHVIVHLAYSSPAARIELVTERLSALSDGSPVRWWLFTDVPLLVDGRVRQGLEVIMGGRPGEAVCLWVEKWIGSLDGLEGATALTTASLALRPDLFPGATVPACYVPSLVIGSTRAARLLAVAGGRIGDDVVQEEIAATWQDFFPDPDVRRTALAWHARWLRIQAQSLPPGSCSGPGDDAGRQTAPSPELPGYAALREPMRRQSRRIASRAGASGLAGVNAVQTALVARLIHTQVLRLWGPDYPSAIEREVDLIAGILGTGAR